MKLAPQKLEVGLWDCHVVKISWPFSTDSPVWLSERRMGDSI